MDLHRDIRSKLKPILGPSYTRQQLNEFVAVCHSLAVIALRCRTRTLRYLTRFHFTNESDVAYECISDLFKQNTEGSLLELTAYFEGIDFECSSDAELLVHLRRLVFSKVNYGLFRILNELDPTLGKILRNIRLAAQTLQNYDLVQRFGEHCIVPAMCDTLEHLPTFEPWELERELHRVAHRTEHVPGLLAQLSLFLREQKSESRIVPVMAVAVAIKSFYEQQTLAPDTRSEVMEQIQSVDVVGILEGACREVRKELEPKYIKAGKLTGKEFDRYFGVIRQLLIDRIVSQDNDGRSLFERLRIVMPGLTKEQYKSSHRAKLEYLARITELRAKEEVRAEMFEWTTFGSGGKQRDGSPG